MTTHALVTEELTLPPPPIEVPTAKRREITRGDYVKSALFIGWHGLTVAAAWWVGVQLEWVIAAVAAYFLRMFFITAGFHRYFAHRSYKTSRWFQLLLAFGGTTAAQKGVLWWAGHHRDHHRTSDTPDDIHSPRQKGFFWSHMGWIVSSKYMATPVRNIRDFASYPELRWINERFLVIPLGLMALIWLTAGAGYAIWIGMVSTVALWHGTFTINSLAHVFGSRRFDTKDDSRNNLLLALITMGEGWHNNHHHYQCAANQGFYWYEIDLSFMILRVLEKLGIVWDLKRPPRVVLEAGLANEKKKALAAA